MKRNIDESKLTIPIYLNTKVVFDMLATIEGGFSEIKNIQISKKTSKEDNAEANIGSSNLFAFLNIGIRGNLRNNNSTEEMVNEEKTHTTVSLFQNLKCQLDEQNLIKRDIDSINIGDFVELQGILKTNPVIDMLSGLKELMEFANLFSDNKNNNKTKAEKFMSNNKFNAQIDGLIKGLQAGGKKDIICETEDLSVVLPTDENYFLNGNMTEITDGNYKILGKIVKICKEEGEISLLRNTVFSRLQLDKMKEFQELLNDPSLSQFVGEGGIATSVKAPVIMIIPIAIYI